MQVPVEVGARRRIRRDEEGNEVCNVANKGVTAGALLTKGSSKGEFEGLSLLACSSAPPLWTIERVEKAAAARISGEKEDVEVARSLHYVDISSIDAAIAYYFLDVLKLPIQNLNSFFVRAYREGKERIRAEDRAFISLCRSDPLAFPFIVQSGPQWMIDAGFIGRRFEDGNSFHAAIDQLPIRAGRPKTTYAAIYTMHIQKQEQWLSASEIAARLIAKDKQLAITLFIDYEPPTDVRIRYERNIESTDYRYGYLPPVKRRKELNGSNGIIIAIRGFDAAESATAIQRGAQSIGFSQSKLQKGIRRQAMNAISDSVKELLVAPIVYRPEFQFAACSGIRQLLWRLFISSLEDASPWKHGLSLEALGALSLVAHFDPNFRLPAALETEILRIALLVGSISIRWPWKSLKERFWAFNQFELKKIRQFGMDEEASPLQNTIKALLRCMPCLSSDIDLMLALYIAEPHHFVDLGSIEAECREGRDAERNEDAETAAFDFHADPTMILFVQAEHPDPPRPDFESTTAISKAMWKYRSSINVRCKNQEPPAELQHLVETIKSVQHYELRKRIYDENVAANFEKKPALKRIANYTPSPLSAVQSREAFISVWGSRMFISIGSTRYSVTVSGTPEQPCLIQKGVSKQYLGGDTGNPYKFLEGAERKKCEDRWLAQARIRGFVVKIPEPPAGYHWTFGEVEEVLLKAQRHPKTKKIQFFAGDIEMNAFEASSVLQTSKKLAVYSLDGVSEFDFLVKYALYVPSDEMAAASLHLKVGRLCDTLVAIGDCLRVYMKNAVFDWIAYAKESRLEKYVFRDLLVKIETREDGFIDVAQVDRRGKRSSQAVRYETEGTMIRLLCLLCFLYPTMIKRTGKLRFSIDASNACILHLVETLRDVLGQCFDDKIVDEVKGLEELVKNGRQFIVPTTSTKASRPRMTFNAWPHQKETALRIASEVSTGKKGFADGSTVGSGKTATALNTITHLLYRNWKLGIQSYGFLVLTPTITLLSTWEDEIKKHTKDFIVLIQQSDGSFLLGYAKKKISAADAAPWLSAANAIVVTTLGRARDHPFHKQWSFVVIDECTSVQNDSALQTAEAWRQIISSSYGVLMLSATFFRSRYSKLFYMIRMLQSPIPRTEPYLNALLHERIICHVPNVRREWKIKYCAIELDAALRKAYNEILALDQTKKAIYAQIVSFLQQKFNVIRHLIEAAEDLQSSYGRKVLIFARSKEQKEELLRDRRLPPQTSVYTLQEGSHGLNLQFDCDAIVTQPVTGDFLEQMKGRIDRPGQVHDTLHLSFVYAKDTIQEFQLANLNICNGFVKQYLMPYSQAFQTMALGGSNSARNIRKRIENGEFNAQPVAKRQCI